MPLKFNITIPALSENDAWKTSSSIYEWETFYFPKNQKVNFNM